MSIQGIDHIVISVSDLQRSILFYQKFLGKGVVSKDDASWKIGKCKLFLTGPYKKSARKFDKHNIGLNHIAFGVSSKEELLTMQNKLDKEKIKHSSIVKDQYSNNLLIWFDDPDNIRLEFYFRK